MILLVALAPRDLPHPVIVVEDVPVDPDRLRRRALAAFVPRLIVRWTFADAAGSRQAYSLDTPRESYDWPLGLGTTLELRALWTFDRATRRVATPFTPEETLP